MQKHQIPNHYHSEGGSTDFRAAVHTVTEGIRTPGDATPAVSFEALPVTDSEDDAHHLPVDTCPLVFPKAVKKDLTHLVQNVKRQTSAHRFLFLGASGTGKTAAAQMLANRTERSLYFVDLADTIGDSASATANNLKHTFALLPQGPLIVVDGLTSLTADGRSRPAATFRQILAHLSPQTVVVVTADLSADEIEAWPPYFDAVLDFDRYTEADRLKAADVILTHQRSLLQRSGDAHPKLLHRLLQLNGASPFPGTVKMLLRSSLTLSDPDKPTDYLRHLFETLTKTRPLSLQDLRNKGLSVRDIEVLTGTPKSTVARLTQTTFHSGNAPATNVPQHTRRKAPTVLHYQGYSGSVEIDLESDKLCGKVMNIRSLIVYEADTVSELRRNFQIAVDDYLDLPI